MQHAQPKIPGGDCCAAGAKHDPHAAHAGQAAHAGHLGHAGHAANAGHAGHAAHGAHAAHAGHLGHGITSLPRLTTSATLHCLTGCAIGEFIGLAIGVSLGLNPWATMALATLLGFASGYALGLRPLVQQGMGWGAAFRAIWLGETVSIAFMEFAMNFTDYHVGGVTAASVLAPQFWIGFLLALPAGFVVAWPVNYWLLRKQVKKPCH